MKIVAICGKSACGKSTLINRIEQQHNNIHVVKSYTTRAVREHDKSDKFTHTFVDETFYEKNKDKAISIYNAPQGYVSWTDESSFDKNKVNLYAIDVVEALRTLTPYCKKHNHDLTIVYLNMSEEIRKKRYLEREGTLDGYSAEEHLDVSHLDNCDEGYIVFDTDISCSQDIVDTLIELEII